MTPWEETELGDVLTVRHGFAFPGEGMTDELTGNPTLVSIGNFDYDGGFRFESTRVREFRGEYPSQFELDPADLLVVMTCQTPGGEILGLPGLVPDDGKTYLHNQRIGRVECAPGRLDKNFAYYLFLSHDVNRQLVATATGTKILHTSPERIGRVRAALPGVAEQAAIARVLAALDDKIAVNKRITAKADALSHAVYSQRFGVSAGPVRSDWTAGRLSDLCSTQYGYTATSTTDPVGPKFLRVKDINKNNWITWPEVPHCAIDDPSLDKYRLSVGDLLVARMADPGKSAIVEDPTDAVFASYLVRLKTASLAHSYFVWGFLKSDAYGKYAESTRSGSVQANMNAKVIVGAELLIPPSGPMEAYLGAVLPLRRRLTAALRESRALAALRDTLLPQLMSGRLRVRDAEKIVEDHV
ncbi:restriction endonuclease subunit S [Streptomyces sp. NPDC057249]|uniref:restriction endonuclease subunit S n=1 Tax=Streptomyces sp. NPDC057249 TaxID=3346067 RepID=UPI00363A6B1C